MAKTTVAIDLQAQTKGTESVKSLKAQIREATQEAVALAQKFGEFSPEAQNATKRVAELKDQMEDFQIRVQGLNPDKFQVLANIGVGIARGIQGATGAMQLFGIESETAQKALVKVQAASAFAEGVQGVIDMTKGMKGFVKETVAGFKGIKGAIAATGIGLLLVALGTVAAYWDDIKGAIGGVTAEQEKLNKKATENVEAEKQKTELLELSENTLKLQGKSERDIQKLKIDQINTEIEKQKVVIANAKTTRDLEVAAAKRNKEFAKGAIRFALEVAAAGVRLLVTPLDLLIKTANAVSETLGFGKITAFSFNEEIDKMIEKGSEIGAKFIFNPDEVAKEGDKAVKAAEKTGAELVSKRDGLILAIKQADQQAAQEGAQRAEEEKQKALERQATMLGLDQSTIEKKIAAADAAFQTTVANLRKQGFSELEIAMQRDAALEKIREEHLQKLKDADEKAKAEALKREEEHQKKLKEFQKSQQDSLLKANEDYYKYQELQLLQNGATQEEFNNLELERLQTNLEAMRAINGENSAEAIAAEAALAAKKKEIRDKDLADKRAAEQQQLAWTAQGFAAIAELADAFAGKSEEQQKKAFEIRKKASIAQAIVETIASAQSAFNSQIIPGDPTSPIRGAIAAALAIASGIARVKKIEQTKFESKSGAAGGGGGGGNNPSAPNTTPVTGGLLPDMEQPGGFAGMGRVYVLEGDITKTQTRVRRVRNVSVV